MAGKALVKNGWIVVLALVFIFGSAPGPTFAKEGEAKILSGNEVLNCNEVSVGSIKAEGPCNDQKKSGGGNGILSDNEFANCNKVTVGSDKSDGPCNDQTKSKSGKESGILNNNKVANCNEVTVGSDQGEGPCNNQKETGGNNGGLGSGNDLLNCNELTVGSDEDRGPCHDNGNDPGNGEKPKDGGASGDPPKETGGKVENSKGGQMPDTSTPHPLFAGIGGSLLAAGVGFMAWRRRWIG
ncbi:hypothetical protein C8P63_11380 [Melghirimyces profundicolus]|uniref:LPXTG-motif cell wall-anchored protein n=1 Tax=Melghirimyces profundicolus TaxID=1242148 RepID=A0A2T6BSR6_9BACL|nr:hypothetical protein [Melghirimyces profundicolus]PTX59135.1 hypothetical protein C8P63_11380 [Melghirimyces profundicolus]